MKMSFYNFLFLYTITISTLSTITVCNQEGIDSLYIENFSDLVNLADLENSDELLNQGAKNSDPLKVRRKTWFLKKVKFLQSIEVDRKATFNKNIEVKNTGSFNEINVADKATIGCDVTIGCNIDLNNSTSAAVGNVLKNGEPFIHNYGSANTFVGYDSGNFSIVGSGNSGFGTDALMNIANGMANTGIGFSSLVNNTDGTGNTAQGVNSLAANTTGNINCAFGAYSLTSNTTGSGNSGYGYLSLASNTIGDNNTAHGFSSLNSNVTGSGNTACGVGALSLHVAGLNNNAFGFGAGSALTSGNNNIYIANPGQATESNVIRIGTLGTHTATYVQGIYNSTIAMGGLAVEVDSTGRLGTTVSSQQYKRSINSIADQAQTIYSLRPVSFYYRSDESDTLQYGLIAEEVDQVNKDLVIYDENGNPHAVRYQQIPTLLIKVVQDQLAMIQALSQRIALLEARN